MSNTDLTIRLALLLSMSPCLAAGCQSLPEDWAQLSPWGSKAETVTESEYPQPVRMAVMWTNDVLTQPGTPPVRGFGGRIYFYDERNKAVPVEGQLVVYAYDDTDTEQGATRSPLRKFAFTPDQFTKHLSESNFGTSYSVWLPWDSVGGEQKSISLVPVFTSTGGKIVMGDQATSVLPGQPGAPQALAFHEASRQAKGGSLLHAKADGGANTYPNTTPSQRVAGKPKIRTTTIELPPATQRRLALAGDTTGPVRPNRGYPNREYRSAGKPATENPLGAAVTFGPTTVPSAPASRGGQPYLPFAAAQAAFNADSAAAAAAEHAARFGPGRPQAPASPAAQSSPADGPRGPHLLAPPSDHLLSRQPARRTILGLADEPNATRFRR